MHTLFFFFIFFSFYTVSQISPFPLWSLLSIIYGFSFILFFSYNSDTSSLLISVSVLLYSSLLFISSKVKGSNFQFVTLLWCSKCILRHSFVFWKAIKGKLRLKDKLLRWGVISYAPCLLCNQEDENLRHLFFYCPFSKSIWLKVSNGKMNYYQVSPYLTDWNLADN